MLSGSNLAVEHCLAKAKGARTIAASNSQPGNDAVHLFWNFDLHRDDDSDDDGDPGSTELADSVPAAPTVAGPPKITVDAMFGWRWPLSEEDQERIRCAPIQPLGW